MKNAPMTAGSNKLIIQSIKVAEKIEYLEIRTSPNNLIATDPLIPISVIAKDGKIEITKNIVVVKIIASK